MHLNLLLISISLHVSNKIVFQMTFVTIQNNETVSFVGTETSIMIGNWRESHFAWKFN